MIYITKLENIWYIALWSMIMRELYWDMCQYLMFLAHNSKTLINYE